MLLWVITSACGSYRQNIMFHVDDASLEQQVQAAERNTTIKANDLLTMQVYTNQGEKIVDPNRELIREGSEGNSPEPLQYLVDVNGIVRFPLIEPVNLAGLTLKQAEEVLAQSYGKYYEGAYVVLNFTNKRVIVLGAPGGKVIPLTNENVRLAEVLALAEGISVDGKSNNIRVIRDDKVMVADFSTIEGYRRGNFILQPGDIIYVEPVRRPFIEGLRDYAPMITVISSLATLIFVITESNTN
jgi:polysaccharide export outer membrane protein